MKILEKLRISGFICGGFYSLHCMQGIHDIFFFVMMNIVAIVNIGVAIHYLKELE